MTTRSILLYGRTRAGKTALVSELAEHVKITTGKKSLIYHMDDGGIGPLIPHIELGIVDVVFQQDTNPWIFLNSATNGKVRDASGKKWVKADLSQYGLVVFESLTSASDALMLSLANKAADGINIGGSGNVSFTEVSDGETLKVGGSNMGHYNVVQTRVLDEFARLQKLPVPYILWTASVSKDDDAEMGGKVVGPNIAGKAKTPIIPGKCDLTFRVDCLPASGDKPERHILYLGNSVDVGSGNATALGNTRIPLGVELPKRMIEPASLVQALKEIDDANNVAKTRLQERIAKAMKAAQSTK